MSKDRVFQLRLSAEERKAIEERMAKIGVKNFSAYLRKMALNGYYIVLDLSDVKELLRLLRICSNNLNQYAKKANETDSIYKAGRRTITRNTSTASRSCWRRRTREVGLGRNSKRSAPQGKRAPRFESRRSTRPTPAAKSATRRKIDRRRRIGAGKTSSGAGAALLENFSGGKIDGGAAVRSPDFVNIINI